VLLFSPFSDIVLLYFSLAAVTEAIGRGRIWVLVLVAAFCSQTVALLLIGEMAEERAVVAASSGKCIHHSIDTRKYV